MNIGTLHKDVNERIRDEYYGLKGWIHGFEDGVGNWVCKILFVSALSSDYRTNNVSLVGYFKIIQWINHRETKLSLVLGYHVWQRW